MKNGVTSKGGDRAQALLAALKRLEKKDVLVGIPRDTAQRDDGELNNAARLYIHEYGAPEANIPARSTVMPGIDNAAGAIGKYMEAAARAAAAGKPELIEVNMNRAGLAAEDGIKEMINSNVPPPLAERTLQDRRERGITRTNTLIDQAEMRNAVVYVLRDKNG